MKSKIDHRSDRAFSIGVPVNAKLTSALIVLTLIAFFVV